jgi:hypothetical protein
MRSSRAVRAVLAGLAGTIAWIAGIVLFFGPAQALLADPARQSPKMMAAFTTEPLPRVEDAPGMFLAGFAIIGIVWGFAYVFVASSWRGSWWNRGLRFGALGWALMAPWFEFYLPWNVLREPAPLVLLELLCWALVLLGVGLAIAGVEAALRPRAPAAAAGA